MFSSYKYSDITHCEFWTKRAPRIRYVKALGCLVKVALSEPKNKKIGPKTLDTRFIRYALDSNTTSFFGDKL